MFDAALAALGSLLTPSTLVLLAIGVVAGLAIGVLPGMGGTAAVAILLPFVVTLEPSQSLALLIGAVAVVHHSDVISAILLRVPGSASAAVVMEDGNALAKQGQAARAFALVFMTSMFGGLLGAIGLTFSIPIARPLVLTFGSPELFMLTVLGISLAALLSQGSMLKGIVAGVLGMLIGLIGAAPAAAVYRYSFGLDSLLDGIGLIPVALGFFGFAEIAHLVARKSAMAERMDVGSGWRRGLRESLQYWKLTLRGALVGMWAGVLPGLGATAGTYMAYGQAVATAKKDDRKRFGKGDPRGLVSAESAVNAVEAGDLIPTMLFGIPGGAPAALLLGALLAYGIQPGPRMVTDHLDVMYTIVWAFAIASVVGSLLCFLLTKPLSRLSYVPFQYLAPGLLIIMLVAAFQDSGQFGDLVAMLVLGVLGYVLKEAAFPRAPFLIGFILSVPLERYYFLTSNLYTTTEWISRPYVIGMLVILVLPLVLALVRRLRGRTATSSASDVGGGDEEESSGPTTDMAKTRWTVVIAALMLAVFVIGFIVAESYPPRARLVPVLVTVAGMALSLALVVKEAVAVARRERTASWWRPELARTAAAFGWVAFLLVLMYALGFVLGAVAFVVVFSWRVARLRAFPLVIYAACTVVVLVAAIRFAGIDAPIGLFFPAVPFT
ncbi:MAG: tripartite tricarboxylate transporter permease [Streptosporangiales bacterium]